MEPIKQTTMNIPSMGCAATLHALLTKDAMGSYAVYLAIIAKDNPVSAQQVMNEGEKASYTMALQFFPTLTESEYRR